MYYVVEILVNNSIISVHLISDVVLCQSAVRRFLVTENKVHQKKACKWEYLYYVVEILVTTSIISAHLI